jgi:hypothetical protein
MCDLWWTKWRWSRFSPSTSVSPANYHSTNYSTITIIYHHLGLVKQASSCRNTEWNQSHSTKSNKRIKSLLSVPAEIQTGHLQNMSHKCSGFIELALWFKTRDRKAHWPWSWKDNCAFQFRDHRIFLKVKPYGMWRNVFRRGCSNQNGRRISSRPLTEVSNVQCVINYDR